MYAIQVHSVTFVTVRGCSSLVFFFCKNLQIHPLIMDRAMAPLLHAVDWVYVCTYQSLLCVLDCVMDFSAASGHCRVQRLSVRLLRWLDLLAGIRSSEDRLAPPPHRAVTAARALYVKIPQCYGECLRFTGVSKGEETMQILKPCRS